MNANLTFLELKYPGVSEQVKNIPEYIQPDFYKFLMNVEWPFTPTIFPNYIADLRDINGCFIRANLYEPFTKLGQYGEMFHMGSLQITFSGNNRCEEVYPSIYQKNYEILKRKIDRWVDSLTAIQQEKNTIEIDKHLFDKINEFIKGL